ncbi:MAG: adenylate/guanylate cyclase domain-containing protein [Spirochaetes bacterium]|nr:adenylate/guanylate cyclase domain-containing protein [Spirochaetota bacterium]MBU1078908.1 adenylate/guanylate cyclase domain-containing protein [Spirochaetota bacterium]
MRIRAVADAFGDEALRIQKKAQILLNIDGWTGIVALALGAVMAATGALVAAAFCFLMVGVCFGIILFLRKGMIKAASNAFIFSLFAIMWCAIKFDAYVSAYETYVFAALGLVLLIVTSLINVGRWQIAAVTALDVAGILALWLLDILPSRGGVMDLLQVQNLATSLVLVILGSVAGISLVSLQDNLLIVTEEERDRIRKMLVTTEVYTKKSLVSIIAQGKDPTTFLPEEKENAILFCDIRSFTTLSEKMKTIDVVGFLNSFFSRMNQVIQEHGGEIDKLIGDCIMASFAGRENALRCSVDMRKALQAYNAERVGYGLSPIRVGIGVSFGSVIIGNIGSRNKMDFTLIGDIVNVSSRLESLTKIYGLDILTSIEPEPSILASENFRYVDSIKVKGRKWATDIFELFDHEPSRFKDFKIGNRAAYDEAYGRYKAADFAAAARIYEELIGKAGPHTYIEGVSADPVLDYYRSRCLGLVKSRAAGLVSAEDWDGVYTFIA